jgi:RNA polymerase sigma factor (sigma-70 family)
VATAFARARHDWQNRPDYIQEGNLGLLEAVKKFDPEQGAFSTYAIYWIRQRIGRYAQTSLAAVQLPANAPREHCRAWQFCPSLEHGENLSADESLRLDVVDQAAGLVFEQIEHHDQVRSLLAVLGPRERDLIERHYGLGSYEGKPSSLQAIGEVLGLSRERVRQIEEQARLKMRVAALLQEHPDLPDESVALATGWSCALSRRQRQALLAEHPSPLRGGR